MVPTAATIIFFFSDTNHAAMSLAVARELGSFLPLVPTNSFKVSRQFPVDFRPGRFCPVNMTKYVGIGNMPSGSLLPGGVMIRRLLDGDDTVGRHVCRGGGERPELQPSDGAVVSMENDLMELIKITLSTNDETNHPRQ